MSRFILPFGLALGLSVSMASDTDAQRQGFIIGFGAGPSVTTGDVDSKVGVSTDFKIGGMSDLLESFLPSALLYLDEEGRRELTARLDDPALRDRVRELRRLVSTPQAIAIKTRKDLALGDVVTFFDQQFPNLATDLGHDVCLCKRLNGRGTGIRRVDVTTCRQAGFDRNRWRFFFAGFRILLLIGVTGGQRQDNQKCCRSESV